MGADAIKTIGVVGAGTMGRGIAEVFAVKGFDVLLAIDDRGRTRCTGSLGR